MENGLAAAEWHHTYVPRSERKELMHRTDRHVERHMFPMVPCHALSRLRESIRHCLPSPDGSIRGAHRKVLPVLMRQLRAGDVLPVRGLPETARSHRAELHDAVRA